MDHLKLEEACLVADSFLNSPFPYSDTMVALNERYGQPHKLALKKIASVMDSAEVRRVLQYYIELRNYQQTSDLNRPCPSQISHLRRMPHQRPSVLIVTRMIIT